MNYLDSECSSGCESGWTVYLEQSFLSPNASAGDFHGKTTGKFCNGIRRNEKEDNDEEDDDVKEEEDLSMVSDASSGPPHNFHEDNEIVLRLNHNSGEDYKCSKSGGEERQKMKEQQAFASFRPHREQPSFLDDTASSPLFNFSNNNMQDFAMTNDKQVGNNLRAKVGK
ncbi:hypothetical protein TIFTF001_007203 [Ficus carica]|uniref:Uncharacterized protein n=1 Tax=Ficus carica TaxID=3494 RepID=A0AA88A5Z5_FICCA|nr:hypothetical protein TIFTF001_007203 [Ficus carica]